MNNFVSNLKHYFQVRIYAPLYKIIDSSYNTSGFRLLDVGCGGNSVITYKKLFPNVEYHGIDYMNPGLIDSNKSRMHRFYELNLNSLDYQGIPDQYFDCIVFSHVLEHLENPIAVLMALETKLKQNGMVFIEYPSTKSIHLPSAKKIPFVQGTLNFYDDTTHVTLVNTPKVIEAMQGKGFKIINGKLRRNAMFMALSPFIIPLRFAKNKFKVKASDLWDFTGFAQLVYFRRDALKPGI